MHSSSNTTEYVAAWHIATVDSAARQTIPVSIIIMTKNEERAIATAIASVSRFDQVFVLDSGSTDATSRIAESAGASVVQFCWNGKYPKKKEWALLNLPLANDWVLYLDADEAVTPDLAAEISRVMAADDASIGAYEIELDYSFLGHKLRYGHRVAKRALVRRSRTTWPIVDDLDVTSMWEVEGHYQPIVHGRVGALRGRIIHDDPDPLFDYFATTAIATGRPTSKWARPARRSTPPAPSAAVGMLGYRSNRWPSSCTLT